MRQDDRAQEISVSLYGEVQKEVIQATLADDYGLDVDFRETTTICVERPVARRRGRRDPPGRRESVLRDGRAARRARTDGSGIEFRLDVDPARSRCTSTRPPRASASTWSEYVRRTLQEGLFGWQVTDCVVTMIECGYYVGDGPPSRPGTAAHDAADFRKLTPMVLMQALERARTVVCEPVLRVRLEFPAETIGAVLAALARLGAVAQAPSLRGELATIETVLPAARVQTSSGSCRL